MEVEPQQEEDLKKFDVSALPSDPESWEATDVVNFIAHVDPTLSEHVEIFHSHEIDGKALSLLNVDMILKYMNVKLGPALKIYNIINMLQGKKHLPIIDIPDGAGHLKFSK